MRFQALAQFARKSIRVGALGSAVWAASVFGAQATDSLFNVAKVSVDTTAKDAVAARNKGMGEAQMRAWQTVVGRLVPLDAQGLLPEFTKEEVEQLVTGVAVRKEQTSTTRYIATLDVNFNEYAVKQLLVGFGIPFSEDRAPPIFILPVMGASGGVSGEAWRQAWEDLDLSNGVTPASVLPLRTDVDAATMKRAASGDAEAIATVQSAYGRGSLLMAIGEVKDRNFTTRLIGEDGVGTLDFTQSAAIRGGDEAAAQKAAAAALAILENRWKVMRSGGQAPATGAYEGGPPAQAPEQALDAPAVVPRNVVALVEFTGLRNWQEIRTRLTQMAGLQGLEVNSLSARTASVTFDFAGSLDTLQTALAQNGFVLNERDGTFVVRSQ